MFPDNNIRKLRKSADLTQAELGQAVGLHQTQIGKFENGDRNLTIEWARRIARVIGDKLQQRITVADLLGDEDMPYRLTDEERALVEHFRTADDGQRQLIHRVAEPISSYNSEARAA